ncbi:TetR/AcrR family transcriptional regulator [Streptacidiphilus monticola]|jgi:AcrR family transcriptional regulator|uniref:TetR/AcrR family transcriptional regulator n=1 Tax=Streptacidiphilus monticola TaxID=2161674 RepID=A0ABW1FXZ9_9ACTN
MTLVRSSRSRLTPERELEVYEAVIDLVREVGFDAMTMDAVAAKAKISKATLYRQWQGKPQLVVAAMQGTKPVRLEEIDTGSLRGDLMEMARQVGDGLEEDVVFMSALGHAAMRDAELGQALRENLVLPELETVRRMVDRAVDRGEVSPDSPAIRYVPHMMFGALPARKVVDGELVTPEYLAGYIDAVVLPALGHS